MSSGDSTAPTTVVKDIGTPATPPTPPTPPAPAAGTSVEVAEQTRKDILERVEKGELSVTDAVELLRG
jgi:hypothetical protein